MAKQRGFDSIIQLLSSYAEKISSKHWIRPFPSIIRLTSRFLRLSSMYRWIYFCALPSLRERNDIHSRSACDLDFVLDRYARSRHLESCIVWINTAGPSSKVQSTRCCFSVQVIGSSSDDSSDICENSFLIMTDFFHPHWTFRSVMGAAIFLRHLQINRYRCNLLSLSFFLLVSVRSFWMTNRIRKHLLDSSDFFVTHTRRRKQNIRGFDDTSIDVCVIISLSLSLSPPSSLYLCANSLSIHLLEPSNDVRKVSIRGWSCYQLLDLFASPKIYFWLLLTNFTRMRCWSWSFLLFDTSPLLRFVRFLTLCVLIWVVSVDVSLEFALSLSLSYSNVCTLPCIHRDINRKRNIITLFYRPLLSRQARFAFRPICLLLFRDHLNNVRVSNSRLSSWHTRSDKLYWLLSISNSLSVFQLSALQRI